MTWVGRERSVDAMESHFKFSPGSETIPDPPSLLFVRQLRISSDRTG